MQFEVDSFQTRHESVINTPLNTYCSSNVTDLRTSAAIVDRSPRKHDQRPTVVFDSTVNK